MRKSAMIGIGAAAAALVVAGVVATTTTGPGDSAGTAIQFVDSSTPIGQGEAEKAALAEVPGGHVTETRLDTENGHAVWNVHLRTADGEHEVKVDAQTGAVRVDDHDARSDDATGHHDDADDDDHGESRDDSDSHPDDSGTGGHGSDDGPNHS